MTGDLTWLVTVVLFIWSAVLVWASLWIGWMFRLLAEERRELSRWKRVETLAKRQKWQDDYYR